MTSRKVIGEYTLEKSIEKSEILIYDSDKCTKHQVPPYVFRDIWPIIDCDRLVGRHFVAGLRTAEINQNMFLLNIYLGLKGSKVSQDLDKVHIYNYLSSEQYNMHPLTVSKELIDSATKYEKHSETTEQ